MKRRCSNADLVSERKSDVSGLAIYMKMIAWKRNDKRKL